MASIYVHIPLCKTRCNYCAFYSTTRLEDAELLVDGICRELVERRNFLLSEPVRTIYFGGGTPSLLSIEQINRILTVIRENYSLSINPEITMEANPGDLIFSDLSALRETAINRLSIGIQSFHPDALKRINRRHSAEQAVEAVHIAQQAGFSNISIDLIYGLPQTTMDDWKSDIQQALTLHVPHISAYALSYEEGTPLYKQLQQGTVTEISEEGMLERMDYLSMTLQQNGYEHYEVSNYALPGFRSQHNSSYWDGTSYLGVGPGAHSYDGKMLRHWNTAWLPRSSQRQIPWDFEEEYLTEEDLYDEYVMLRLRTKEGVDLSSLEKRFGKERLEYFMSQADSYLVSGHLQRINTNGIATTQTGLHLLNRITSDLFAE